MAPPWVIAATFGVMALSLACPPRASASTDGPFWVGPQIHFPLPARDVGDSQLGVDAGVTFTQMVNENGHVGVGLDIVYHYWPASRGFQADYDRHLRDMRLQTLGASALAFTALQMTAHVRFVAPLRGRWTPWAQVGLGPIG